VTTDPHGTTGPRGTTGAHASTGAHSPPLSADAVPVLGLTSDVLLADQLHRLGAAAGVDVVVEPEAPAAAQWGAARLIVVGSDLARAVAAARRPRRPAVVLVTTDLDDADVWQHALGLGAEQVVVLPDAQEWLVERMARTVEPAASGRVLAVIGASGGAGASTMAAALAATAADGGRRVLLADLDPLGGGIDLLVGADDLAGLRWPDLTQARGRLPADSVHEALPRLGTMAVLAWGRGEPLDVPLPAAEAVLDAGRRGNQLVVCDLPRQGDEVSARVLRRADELLVVVPARLRAAVAGAQLLASLGACAPAVRAVVRRPPGAVLASRAVCDVLGVPLAAEMVDEPGLDAAIARGCVPGLRGRSALHRAAEQCLHPWGGERAA
jgi:secretion/DNA translocation related CpaE-like protein